MREPTAEHGFGRDNAQLREVEEELGLAGIPDHCGPARSCTITKSRAQEDAGEQA